MKLYLWIAFAIVFLTAAGYVLLRTSQAPLAISPAAAPTAVPNPAPVAAPAPVPGGNPAAPAEPVPPKLDKEGFRALGDVVLKSLPDKDSLGTLREGDAFVAPLPILKAGRELSRLAEAVHQDPALGESAIAIYRECAGSGDLPISVRALCLNYFRRLARKSGKPTPEGFAPAFVRELADKLAT